VSVAICGSDYAANPWQIPIVAPAAYVPHANCENAVPRFTPGPHGPKEPKKTPFRLANGERFILSSIVRRWGAFLRNF